MWTIVSIETLGLHVCRQIDGVRGKVKLFMETERIRCMIGYGDILG